MKIKDLCQIAILTATLTCGKLALSFIPNVEIVTLFIALYAVTFGPLKSGIATLVFCLIECLLYGFGYWALAYFIYWPTLCMIFSLTNLKKVRVWLIVAVGVLMTTFFGVLTTFVECLFLGAMQTGRFWYYFGIRYTSGAVFFITHIVSNFFVLSFLFFPLYNTMKRLNSKRRPL